MMRAILYVVGHPETLALLVPLAFFRGFISFGWGGGRDKRAKGGHCLVLAVLAFLAKFLEIGWQMAGPSSGGAVALCFDTERVSGRVSGS